MKISNPPFSAQLFQAVYGAQPQLVGESPSFYDFVTGSLPSGVTFTRASTGWRYNSAGLLVPETSDVPRFQFDPLALTPRGLLIEDAATNLLQRSQEFDNAYWAKTQVSVTADAADAPDGTTTMDRIDDTAVAGFHNVSRSLSVTSGTTYCWSAVLKADTLSWVCLTFAASGFGSTSRTFFDLTNGVVGTTASGVTAFIRPLGGGRYLCAALMTATATASSAFTLELASTGSTASYAGAGNGLYAWGASVTEVDRVTSLIPTTSAAVTRAADVALITSANALADQCWIVKARTPRKISGGAVNVAIQVDDGSGNNRRTLRYGTDGKLHAIATVGGVDQCDLDLGAVANDTDFAVAVRWANDKFAASLNGGAIVTDLSGQNPLGLTTARIGRSSVGNYWNSCIYTIRTLPTASDTDLPLYAA